MEFNDDNLRNHLRDHHSKVPDEFSWGAMQDGIMERIQQQTTDLAAAGKQRARRRYVWLLLPLLIGGSIAVAYHLGTKQPRQNLSAASKQSYAEQNTTAIQNENTATEQQAATAATSASSEASSIGQNTAQESSIVAKSHSKDAPTQNETTSTATKLNAVATASPTTADANTATHHPSASDSNHNSTATTTTEPMTQPSVAQPANPNTDPQQTDITEAATNTKPPLDVPTGIKPQSVAAVTNSPAIAPLAGVRVNSRVRSGGTPWSAVASTGAAFILLPNQPKFTLPTHIQASEKGLISQYARLMIHRELPRGLSAGVGAEWLQMNSQLDYQAKTPTSVFLQNVVVLQKVNAITRDTTNITGDTTVQATATRTVRHFNQSTAINIPVVLSYRTNLGRWSAGANLGAAFNLLTTHSGRTYDSTGQLADITSDGTFLKSRTGLSLISGAQIGYRVLPRAHVIWQIEADKFLGNRSAEAGIQSRPWLFRTGIALQYRF